MNFADVKKLTIDGSEITKIADASGNILWQSGYKNWVKYSTEADDVTIYNGGKGYKDGYRVRSGGAEGGANQASCTGFMPVVAGDVVRLSGYDVKYSNNENAINVYNASHTNIGQISGNYFYGIFASGNQTWDDVVLEKDNVYYWTIPSGYDIAYIRVSGYTNGNGSNMIVTINEEIE